MCSKSHSAERCPPLPLQTGLGLLHGPASPAVRRPLTQLADLGFRFPGAPTALPPVASAASCSALCWLLVLYTRGSFSEEDEGV